MAEKILIIDDNVMLLKIMRRAFEAQEFEVFTARNGTEGLKAFHQLAPDLVILDIMMPGIDGWEVCRRIREVSSIPIIYLTALDSLDDIVQGLERGADDYLAKPFEIAELRARVAAQLRRSRLVHEKPDILRFGGDELVINRSEQRVFVSGEEVSLGPTEYNLLLFLVERAGRILSPEEIYQAVWGEWCATKPERVKWHIWRLRQKIEEDSSNPRFILTERGKGYRFSLH